MFVAVLTPVYFMLEIFTLVVPARCSNRYHAATGKPTYDNTDCCVNGVLNRKLLCSVEGVAPCTVTGDGKSVSPHRSILEDRWPSYHG